VIRIYIRRATHHLVIQTQLAASTGGFALGIGVIGDQAPHLHMQRLSVKVKGLSWAGPGRPVSSAYGEVFNLNLFNISNGHYDRGWRRNPCVTLGGGESGTTMSIRRCGCSRSSSNRGSLSRDWRRLDCNSHNGLPEKVICARRHLTGAARQLLNGRAFPHCLR